MSFINRERIHKEKDIGLIKKNRFIIYFAMTSVLMVVMLIVSFYFLYDAVKVKPESLRYVSISYLLLLGSITSGFSAVFIHQRHERMKIENASRRISSLADIYISMHEIDLVEDKITELQALPYVSQVLSQLNGSIQEMLRGAMLMLSIEEDHPKVLDFVDLDTLDERLGSSNTITQEFRGRHGWSRARIIVVDRSITGNTRKALWMVESIREEKQREERLKRQSEEAKAASEAKGKYLANMSHEIRTPINAILGLDTMILRESTEPQIRTYAADIQNAGHTLLALLGDILDMSKIEAGKLEIIPLEYDLASLIHDVLSMVSIRAESKKLEVKLELDESLPVGLIGDDVRIRQILVNIMNNAVKYTEKGSITLSVTGVSSGNEVLLHYRIQDTGIGIKKEDIAKLFEEFERFEQARNHGIEGTGLGMSITVQLLKLMNSSLQVDSVYGEGSVFSFDLRQKIWKKEAVGNLAQRYAGSAKEYDYHASFTAPDAKLLVVDDNPMNIKVFVNLLKQLRLNIDTAGGGKEALVKLQNNAYDIIFLDHMMPDMDGVQVMREIRTWGDYPNKNTPVIILTANAVVGAREGYLAEGFRAYLSKPVDAEKLERLIFGLLPEDKKQQPQTELQPPAEVTQKTAITAEQMPEIEGVDWEYAKLKLKDLSFVRDIVKDFSVMSESEISVLRREYEEIARLSKSCLTDAVADDRLQNQSEYAGLEEAYRQYRVKVHAMKTTAAMFGALQVSAMAKILEFAARDMDWKIIEALTEVFAESWLQLKQLVDQAFEFEVIQNAQEDLAAIDKELLLQYLDMLTNAMIEMDVDTADAIVEELKQFGYDEKQKHFLEDICIAERNLDSEAITRMINEWKTYIE